MSVNHQNINIDDSIPNFKETDIITYCEQEEEASQILEMN